MLSVFLSTKDYSNGSNCFFKLLKTFSHYITSCAKRTVCLRVSIVINHLSLALISAASVFLLTVVCYER